MDGALLNPDGLQARSGKARAVRYSSGPTARPLVWWVSASNARSASFVPGKPDTACFVTPPSSVQRVCIRVWDDGPGIPALHRRFVFEPFFTTKQGSLGLGLAIARQAAESLDGVLELSEDDTGTCFSLYLPGMQEKEIA